MPVFAVGLQVSGLDFLADKFDVARRQVFLEETQVALAGFGLELFLFDLLFEHIKQVHRVGGNFVGVEVEYLGQDLERKTGRQAIHAFVHTRVVTVLLDGLGFRVGVLEVLAVINPHLGIDVGVFRFFEARQYGELGQHLQGVGCAMGFGQ